jgi:pimeloyl-ACP methyl ester carboxylesterase
VEVGPDFVADKLARQDEMRAYRQLVRLLAPGVPQPDRSEAVPVVLVPGFISGDVSVTLLARHLRRRGHRTFRSEIGANLGCTDAMVERLVRRLEQVVGSEGRPVALVGHSRGGMIANLAARRRRDLVAGIVVLCAPVTGSLSVAVHVRKQLELLFRLNRRGLAGVIGEECMTGECAAQIVAELGSPFPTGVAYTSVYSRTDAIIDWRTCLDPQAELVEVRSSHTGMVSDPAVARIVDERLVQLAATAQRRAG